MKKAEPNNVLRGTVIAIIVLLISILIGKATDLLPGRTVGIGVGVSVIIVLGITGLLHVIERASYQANIEAQRTSHRQEIDALTNSHREEIDFLVQSLQGIIPPSKYDWLLRDADIAKIESKVNGKDIWIISPDLHYDVVEKNFQQLTKKNFTKGITYTYIVPKSEQMRARIIMLQRTYQPYLSQVRIREVPETDFRLLAVTHIDIYDPNSDQARVFLQLPVQPRGHWIEVSRDAAHGLIGRFRKIVEDESLT